MKALIIQLPVGMRILIEHQLQVKGWVPFTPSPGIKTLTEVVPFIQTLAIYQAIIPIPLT